MTVALANSRPSAQGIDPAGIERFLDALEADDQIEPHGLIIQRHGQRVAEGYWHPHDAAQSRLLYSLSKTFTGTALALQLGEGRLRLDDLVSQYLPEAFRGASKGLEGLRIRHIASMATGHDRETIAEARERDPDDPVRGFLQIDPAAEPGSLFAYNQPPVLALATILQRLAGERLVDYLRPRLLAPLSIRDFCWMQTRSGVDVGYTGVYTNLDAVARLGQLYLDHGSWEGRQLLPSDWVGQASSVQVANPANIEPDWRQGYGFQLWMSRHGYRGDGACGQYMVVLPELDTVVALFSCTPNMQRVLDYMWAHLLPAIGNRTVTGGSDEALAARLAKLALPTAAERLGGRSPGEFDGRYRRASDDTASHATIDVIEVAGDRMTLREGDRALEIPLSTAWSTASAASPPVAASAARTADGDVAVDLVMLATPHRLMLRFDPPRKAFTARWPLMPLFGAGLSRYVTTMAPPSSTRDSVPRITG